MGCRAGQLSALGQTFNLIMALGGFSPPLFFTQYRFYPIKSMTYGRQGRGEPVFVNKNNALRGIVECAKINFIKGL